MSNNYFDPTNVNNYWSQEANLRADRLQKKAEDANQNLNQQRASNQANVDLILQLRQKVGTDAEKLQNLQTDNAKLASEKQFFENLLSLPMREIADKSEKFKETYDAQQLVLAKWILSQKAYAETAIQIGLESGKTTDEVTEIYKDNMISVLANTTKHGNNASTNNVLKDNVNKIVKK